MKTAPTLDDVAREAGVSAATVSRVLNEPHRVREATRQRVLTAVNLLGYAPNFGGRVLASRRTDTIGAVIPTMENAIFARGLQAMQDTLSEAGATLLVATSSYDSAREAEQIQALLGRGVEGLLLIGEARDAAVYDLLKRRGLPTVLVWTWRPDCPVPCVGFDNRAAARAMAELVLDFGHERIAMISGITHDNDRAAARVDGVAAALAARGRPVSSDAIFETPYGIREGAAAAERLLSTPDRPTAIICGNDVLAAGAMTAAARLGIRVPEALSITGFDDIDLAEVLTPALTTIHVPHRRMGAAAARLVLALRDDDPSPSSTCFETRIVQRGSLAPPSGSGAV